MGRLPFALQLYTVRDHLEKDLQGTLRKVKEAGYSFVEIGGTYGLTNAAFKKLLDDAGLRAISAHTGYDDVTKNPSDVIEMTRVFGVRYAVIGGIDGRLTPDKQGWLACGEALDEAGAKLRAGGAQLCYHNHAHEFQQIDGEYKLDILMSAAEPENLAAQIDTFWVQYAGVDPVKVIDKYRGRCPLLHIKDMKDAASKDFAEVGRGILDWREIFSAAIVAETKWYIIEQDTCPGDSLDSAAISAAFMALQ